MTCTRRSRIAAPLLFSAFLIHSGASPLAAQSYGAPAPYLWYSDGAPTGDGDMLTIRTQVTITTPTTYYETLGWNQGIEGGGYTGIQDSGALGRNFIFSLWDPTHTSQATTAVYTTPGGQVSRFGGEGTGLHYLNYLYGWKTNQWYRFVVRRWDYHGDTYFGLWTLDETAGFWTHHITMDFPEASIMFVCCPNSFLEDWSGASGQNRRRFSTQDGWQRHAGTGWAPFSAATFDLGPPQAGNPYGSAADGGVQQNAFYLESGGATTNTNPSGTTLDVTVSGSSPGVTPGAVVLTSAYYDASTQALTVAWAPDPARAPFFSYDIRVFDNPGLTGTPLATAADISPSTRSVSIPVPQSSNQYFVSMSATDIFDNPEAPVSGPVSATVPVPPQPAEFLAIDNFEMPPYILGALSGQPASGTGFGGAWAALGQDLTVETANIVGRPTVTAGSAGDYAAFNPPINFSSGQLYISYDISNKLNANLNSSRLDLNLDATPVGGDRALLGAVGANANFNFTVESGLGSSAVAQTLIPSSGTHRLVGVLDRTNHQIAIFVDPTAQSFYNASGGNNASAFASWQSTASLVFQSYSLIDNLSDQASFSDVAFTTEPTVLTKPITQAPPAPTSITLALPNGSGLSYALTAVVSPSDASGSVKFMDGSVSVGSASLTGGWATLTVNNLAPGVHQLSAVYPGDSSHASSTSAEIALTVGQPPPAVQITAIVNGVDYLPAVSSGGWITIFGTNLSATTRNWTSSDFVGNNLPTSLDGVSVAIDGKPAYVYYISATQLNVLAPKDAATGTVNVQVTNALGVSNTATAAKQSVAPAWFAYPQQGGRYAIAQDGITNNLLAPAGLLGVSAATRPAIPGEVIVLYATGLGDTSPSYPDGQIIQQPLPVVPLPQVTLGGVNAQVQYAGIIYAGVYQLNIVVPQVPAGDAALVLTVGGISSQAQIYLPVLAPPPTTVPYTSFQNADYSLYPWVGSKVALLTATNTLDVATVNSILQALDAAYTIYEEITGTDPAPVTSTTLNGRDTIAELPDGNTTCGAGCTYIGATGTEIMATYFMDLYNGVLEHGQYDQVLFYEFGRSFWFYNSQLAPVGPFVTGFAIANRFITMDRIPVVGGPFNGTLPYPQFEQSIVSDLLSAYLADPQYSWENTLAINQPYPNSSGWSSSDLAGSMIYRIYSDNGFNAYAQFWKALAALAPAVTQDDAIRNFLAAATTATGRNYGFLFKGQYAGS